MADCAEDDPMIFDSDTCAICQVKDHDTCPMIAGCGCCSEAIAHQNNESDEALDAVCGEGTAEILSVITDGEEVTTRFVAPVDDDTRTAIVTGGLGVTLDLVRCYLPSNYTANQVGDEIVITGTDVAGWTLDGYVIPRLGSALISAKESV
jgi:hypothetical protein